MGKFAWTARRAADGAAQAPARQQEGLRKNASDGARQMAMLRRIPKMLRFIPGTAQDVRAYFLTLQYWLAGSDENIANLVRHLVDRFADGPRAALRGTLKADGPAEYPEVGVFIRA
jgi:magnesium chelatase subunit H